MRYIITATNSEDKTITDFNFSSADEAKARANEIYESLSGENRCVELLEVTPVFQVGKISLA